MHQDNPLELEHVPHIVVHQTQKLDTKILPDISDPDYSDDEEIEDTREGGQRTLALSLKITRLCRGKMEGDNGKQKVRCIGSRGCHQKWTAPRDQSRILRHAARCGYLAKINKDWVVEAVEKLSKKVDKDIVDDINKSLGLSRKRTHEDLSTFGDESGPTKFFEAAPLKRSKTEPFLESNSKSIASSASSSSLTLTPKDPFTKFQTQGRQELKKKGDRALVDLIICCGIPPRVLEKKHFKNFINIISGGKYTGPSRTTFEDSLVPAYAAAIRVATINHLKDCRDIQITFDGGKLGKKKFYSVHATTPNRQSFCLELDDVTGLSQTGEYIFDLLKKVSLNFFLLLPNVDVVT